MQILFPGWVLYRKKPNRVKASVIWAIGWLLTEAEIIWLWGDTSEQPAFRLPTFRTMRC